MRILGTQSDQLVEEVVRCLTPESNSFPEHFLEQLRLMTKNN